MKKSNTTNSISIRKIARENKVNLKNGFVYNSQGVIIGSNVYEPRISVRVQTPEGPKKYGVRTSRVVAFVKYGAEALSPNVQVRHKDRDKFNNAADNLILVRRHRGNLNVSQVRRIRTLANRGVNLATIAERTSTSRHQVARIVNGEAYTSVR